MVVAISSFVSPERKRDRQYEGEDIDFRELFEFGLYDEPQTIERPMLTGACIKKQYTWVIKYYGSREVIRDGFRNRQSIFLFPLIPPKIREIECMSPSEWRVFFLGKVSELLESKYGSTFEKLNKLKPDSDIVILQVKHRDAIGFGGEPMGDKYYVGSFVNRVINGYSLDEAAKGNNVSEQCLVFPKTYIQDF